MKLELKHLAPYSSYVLKGFFNNEFDLVTGLDFIDNIVSSLNNGNVLIEDFKPILRPLSDFEEVAAKDLMVKFSTSIDVIQEVWRLIEEKDVKEIKFKAIQMMCENHIDFNKLIEKGLAIDINTLNDKL